MQSHNKITVVKPVASRAFYSPRSFSKLLKDFTATGSPRTASPGEEIIIRRPKAARFTPSLSVLSTETAPTVCQDGGSDAIHEQMDVDKEHVVSFDHLTICQNARKPTDSVKSRLSFDGYNWRKYGQKQVKGSEFPRSYYKCTHPTCPVKRKVETTLDGQIAEIVYNGEHNHPKPHYSKKPSPSMSTEIVVVDAHGTNDAGVASLLGGCGQAPGSDIVPAALRNSCNCLDGFEKTSKLGDYNKSTKDKQLDGPESSRECGSSFHWHKYGQKAVKGISFPRSYCRCNAERCKYVQRASDEDDSEKTVTVTTYEGAHNHD